MNNLDDRAWEIFKKRNALTLKELENKSLCAELRKTTDFALIRLSLSFSDLWGEITKPFKRN